MTAWQWLLQLLAGRPEPQPPIQPTPPIPSIPPKPPQPPLAATDGPALVAAINTERTLAGLNRLIHDVPLDASSAEWSRTQARLGELSHAKFSQRLYTIYPDAIDIGEIVAEGQSSVEAVVAFWMTSDPHRAEILGPFTHCGGGSAIDLHGDRWWTSQFASLP